MKVSIPITLGVSTLFLKAIIAEQYSWNNGDSLRYFEEEWEYETQGKPSKMLQVGRLPSLGCKYSVNFVADGSSLDNTWNAYACNINETVVVENARFMNESGLLKAGYEYFVIDGILNFFNGIMLTLFFFIK